MTQLFISGGFLFSLIFAESWHLHIPTETGGFVFKIAHHYVGSCNWFVQRIVDLGFFIKWFVRAGTRADR